jgi:hypothetical protein
MAGEHETLDDGFDVFTAERECALRAEGLFDVADMYRELRTRVFMSEPKDAFDVETFDRGRTTALLQLIETFPRHLTFYTETGEQLSTEQAMALGGWVPKRRAL